MKKNIGVNIGITNPSTDFEISDYELWKQLETELSKYIRKTLDYNEFKEYIGKKMK